VPFDYDKLPVVRSIVPAIVIKWMTRLGFVLMAGASFFRGLSYYPSFRPDLPIAIEQLSHHGFPIQVWATFWCLSGVMLIVGLFLPKGSMKRVFRKRYYEFRWFDVALLWTIGIYAAWGWAFYISYLQAVLSGFRSTDYVSGIQFIAIAVSGFAGWAYWTLHRSVGK
jgi:hypothetical protein